MDINYSLQGDVTPVYLDYLAEHGPISLDDFANAMKVSVSGLKTNLGSIERSANREYGSETPSMGPENWSTVFTHRTNDGIEILEIVRAYYDEYSRRREETNSGI